MQSTQWPKWRQRIALTTALAVAAGALLGTPASAADGPAPEPAQSQVLAKLHTDAISTFLDDGQFVAATKADLPEGLGTRLDPAKTIFHIDNEAQLAVPAGFEWLAPAGTEVWLAPESIPSGADGYRTLWPGFSTESIPPGGIDGNSTTFKLVDFSAPTGGVLELWRGSGVGQTRMWSSDEGLNEFSIGRTHMHANWAFTKPGRYDLTVEASAKIADQRVADQKVYTFIVGDLPDVATTSTISSNKTKVTTSETFALTAEVTPADAEGYFNFRAGNTVLGHEKVSNGKATFQASGLSAGKHDLTAAFVPLDSTFTKASQSSTVAVTVTNEDGGEFAIAGVAASYALGDTLSARVTGFTPADDKRVYWYLSPSKDQQGSILKYGVTEINERVDASWRNMQLRAASYDTNAKTYTYTDWISLDVAAGPSPVLTKTSGTLDPFYPGDQVSFEASGPDLAPDESFAFGYFNNGKWIDIAQYDRYQTSKVEGNQLTLTATADTFKRDWVIAAGIKRGDLLVGISDSLTLGAKIREIQVQGLAELYRTGSTAALDVSVYPAPADDLTYTWEYTQGSTKKVWGTEKQAASAVTSPELTMTDDGATINVRVFRKSDGAGLGIGYGGKINVTEQQGQLFSLSKLAAHYHSNDKVNLNLTISPAPAAQDKVVWEWQWPGVEGWSSIPEITGTSNQLLAEQALNGVQVRARLSYADGSQPLISETRTIEVDDHGSAPKQKVSITGIKDHYHSGSKINLAAAVAPSSAVTNWQWVIEKPGAEPEVIEGQHASALELTAAKALNNAKLSARLVLPNGTIYVESEPVTIVIDDHDEPTAPTISIEGLKQHYHTGSTLALTANQDPDSGEDHWHWFIKRTGESQYQVISGQATNQLSYQLAKADSGAQVVAKLYNHDHQIIAESAPVTIVIDDHDEPEPQPTTVNARIAASARVGADWVTTGEIAPVVEGTTVWLQRQNSAGAWLPVAKATTDAAGKFRIVSKPAVSGLVDYRVSAAANGAHQAGVSASVAVTVRQNTTVVANLASSARVGVNWVTTGTVSPAKSGSTVWLQRRAGENWVPLAKAITDTAGKFRIESKPALAGSIDYRVSLAADGYRLPALSKVARVSIAQPTKTQASVAATAKYLGSLLVTGKVTPGKAGTTVWLQRQASNGAWLPVAKSTLKSNGEFSISSTARTKGKTLFRVSTQANAPALASVSNQLSVTIS